MDTTRLTGNGNCRDREKRPVRTTTNGALPMYCCFVPGTANGTTGLRPAAPFIPPVWYRARPWDPPITIDAACM